MVYYRKYRPQTISDLDLPSVREKLTAILSSKELPHAFLFTGSKGLGKTSSARILAKAINCEERVAFSPLHLDEKAKSQIEPCNVCDACTSITNGSNIDVLEIDAASNGGVEEMRTLRERVKFASTTLKYKVYIIDEVHMLSTGAFNALLKTLEEPPSHVIFILATTELWKLPATVVSRTFQILFEKPTHEQIANSLERIIEGEKLDIEKEVLLKVAEVSDGAFRDAAKLLEELVLASKGKKITVELFDNTFKTKGLFEEIYDLLAAFERRDAKKALEVITTLHMNGSDFKVVIGRIVDHLRGLLMLRNGIESREKDIKGLSIEDIKNLLEMSNEAYAELKVAVIPTLPLELMTVKFCILDAKKSEFGSQEEDRSQEAVGIKQVTEVGSQETESKSQKTEDKTVRQENILSELIEELNMTNKPGAALLRSARSASLEGGALAIVTPFPIHAERLRSEKVFEDVVKAAESVCGKKVEVNVTVETN